nr:CW-type zinc finger [Tanacetum cinerariifolium]
FILGDRLVTPLNESLMCLTKADRILGIKDALPVNQFVDASSSRHEGVEQIKVKEVKGSCAVVSDTQQTQVPPIEAASHEYWVACDQCNAWRLLPIGITASNLPENWWCSRSTWLPGNNYCDVREDETTHVVREMNYKISSQNTRDTYHANLTTTSETVPNGWKKNKSRPMVATPVR